LMAPKLDYFPPSELPSRVQYVASGKKRKQPVDLKKCELKELLQYECDVDKKDPRAIKCWPLVRSFRLCANGLTVETTAWEEEKNGR